MYEGIQSDTLRNSYLRLYLHRLRAQCSSKQSTPFFLQCRFSSQSFDLFGVLFGLFQHEFLHFFAHFYIFHLHSIGVITDAVEVAGGAARGFGEAALGKVLNDRSKPEPRVKYYVVLHIKKSKVLNTSECSLVWSSENWRLPDRTSSTDLVFSERIPVLSILDDLPGPFFFFRRPPLGLVVQEIDWFKRSKNQMPTHHSHKPSILPRPPLQRLRAHHLRRRSTRHHLVAVGGISRVRRRFRHVVALDGLHAGRVQEMD